MFSYRRSSYSRPEPIIIDSLKKNNLTTSGHMFKKIYQGGDDKLLLGPHLDYSGIFLYKRYECYHDGTALLIRCGCSHYGGLCRYCEVLNTSVFHDLEVPLNHDNWGKMRDIFLHKYQWTEKKLYNWLAFWIKQESLRWNDYKGLVFFHWDKFFNMARHRFFHYLYTFVSGGHMTRLDHHGTST